MIYTIMNKNIPIIKVDISEENLRVFKIIKTYELDYKPYGIKKINSEEISDWLKSRSIPASRDNVKDLLKRIDYNDTNKLVFKSFGLSLSDQYWLKPEGFELKWEDINFFNNDFSDDMGKFLFEDNGIFPSLRTPDNTSNGDLKKSWKIINGKRILIKAGRLPYSQEPFNEVLASEICDRLEFSHSKYWLYEVNDYQCSACENFIDENTELVSAWDIIKGTSKPNHINSYTHFLNLCLDLGVDVKKEIDDMLVLDYLISNEDRHYRNFGLIRNVNSLKFERVAPIFDSGYSMFCQKTDDLIGKDEKSLPFNNKHSKQIKYVDLSNYDFSKLDGIAEFAYKLYSKDKFMEAINIERKEKLSRLLEIKIKKLDILKK